LDGIFQIVPGDWLSSSSSSAATIATLIDALLLPQMMISRVLEAPRAPPSVIMMIGLVLLTVQVSKRAVNACFDGIIQIIPRDRMMLLPLLLILLLMLLLSHRSSSIVIVVGVVIGIFIALMWLLLLLLLGALARELFLS